MSVPCGWLNPMSADAAHGGGAKVRFRASSRSADAVELDDDQRAVVEHRGGPLLVLAPPGSGKSTTIVHAIQDRIENSGVPAEQILALTFSRAAAEELRARVIVALGGGVAPHVATFHSYCYSLVRRYTDPSSTPEPATVRALSADEQQQWIADLLQDSLMSGNDHGWPDELVPALRTAAGASAVASTLSRLRSVGHSAESLKAVAQDVDRADWLALASFLDLYEDALEQNAVMDYSELIARARRLLRDPEVLRQERERLSVVFVDEYQDCDPQQIKLLAELVGGEVDLVAVADPDQSIYRFRGADAAACSYFVGAFGTPERPATVKTTAVIRRFGPELLDAVRPILKGVPLAGLEGEVVRQHRDPRTEGGPSRVRVRAYESESAEAEHIADLLRREKLLHRPDLKYSDMAVLTRTALQLVEIQRALTRAGVPSHLVADDLPLNQQPAAATLVLALRCAVQPRDLTADVAQRLLTSGLVALTPAGRRDWARLVRKVDPGTSDPDRLTARSSRELTVEVLRDPEAWQERLLAGSSDAERRVASKVLGFGQLLARVHEAARKRIPVEDLLWTIWDGTDWPQRLLDEALAGGASGGRADQDLDAVMALFGLASRNGERYRGVSSVDSFVEAFEASEVPIDTIAAQGDHAEGVRLLTAHRAKGLQWPVVVVAGVQEGIWPDLRMRSTLFDEEQIAPPQDWLPTKGTGPSPDGADRPAPNLTPAEVLAEERRLFYVACTRAKQELIVTAAVTEGSGGQGASRLLQAVAGGGVSSWPESTSELPGVPALKVLGRVDEPLVADGVVARLRALGGSDEVSPAVRGAAIARLAALADVLPAANPDRWWGGRDWTRSRTPIAESPVRWSGTSLQQFELCPLQWFVDRRLGAAGISGRAQVFGSVAHALAEAVTNGTLSPDSVEHELDRVWPHMGYEARYESRARREEASQVMRNFLDWHGKQMQELGSGARVMTEDFHEHQIATDHGFGMLLTGTIDRVEIDADGRATVIDLKTSSSPPTQAKVDANVQLAFYQWLLSQSMLSADEEVELAGAALLLLRGKPSNRAEVARLDQPPLGSDDAVVAIDELIDEAAAAVASEVFPARPSAEACKFCVFRAACPARYEGRGVHG